jgi:DNA-binding NarL/FixJ family response regulator
MAGGDGARGRVRVVVLEDHEMVATALEAALDRDPRLEVAAVATTFDQARRAVADKRPDVLVTDLRIDGVEIADQLEHLRDEVPGLRILVVTGWATERTLFECLDHGAQGFLAKSQGLDELVDGVLRVALGQTVVAPPLLPALVRRTSPGTTRDRTELTPREQEVLALMGAGVGTRDMAARLAVSPNTIRNHVRAVLGKLGASTRLEAVTIARRLDLIAPVDP